MQTKVNIFRGQRGGSTLIGLILGLCLGMLALIKWPQLEVPIKALLAEHDIQIETDVESNKRLRPNLLMPGGLADDTLKASTVSEPQVAALRVPVNRTDVVHTDNTSVDAQRAYAPVPNVAETGAVSGANDVRSTTSATKPYVDVLAQDFESDTSRYETREVWQPFSSESAAKAFATVVSNALNIDVHTLRQSDHKIVPIVRCDGRRNCDAMGAEITAFLAGSSESGVYDEI